MKVDTCLTFIGITSVHHRVDRRLVPPRRVIPVALLRLPDVTPTSGILLNQESFGSLTDFQNPLFYPGLSLFPGWARVSILPAHRGGVIGGLRANISSLSCIRLNLWN